MSLLSKLLAPVKWLLKKNSEEVKVSEPITSQDAATASTPLTQEEISTTIANDLRGISNGDAVARAIAASYASARTSVPDEAPIDTTFSQTKNETLSKDDEISAFAAKLKKILIVAGHDIDIIFDDAVSIAKKI